MSHKKVLIVGSGTMGGGYARMISAGRVPEAELVGIVDIDGKRARTAADAIGVAAFDDLAAAIRATRPDAAYVATPDALHRAPVETLASEGVAILVEKPLATTNEDAQGMLDAVTRAGVYAEVNYSNRWNPPFVSANRTIEAGEIGDVRSFNVRLNNPIASPRDRLKWAGSTTSAWFLMSHCLDLAYWLGKKRALRVFASGHKGQLAALGIDTYDWIHAVVQYETGADGVFEAAWILPESWPGGIEFTYRILGSKGVIDIDNTLQNIKVASSRVHYPPTLSWDSTRLGAFVRAIDGQGRTRVPFEDGVECTRTLVAIHRSLESGAVEII